MSTRDIVVVGASAGGVESLRALVSGLSADFPAAVLVVLHVPPRSDSALARILDRTGPLPATVAENGEPPRPGHIYVAPPDRHLMLERAQLRLFYGPRENGHRPAVDALFRSAALHYGPRVVGLVLSGALDDGAVGLAALAARGGLAVVQDPAEALQPSMPLAAIEAAHPDHVVSVTTMPALLEKLCREEIDPEAGAAPSLVLEMETAMALVHQVPLPDKEHPGEPSGYSCPDCGGGLFGIEEAGVIRFRCRVGHAWSPDSLVAEQALAMENALWKALRVLDEKAELCRKLAKQSRERGKQLSAARFEESEREARSAAGPIRELLVQIGGSRDGGQVAGTNALALSGLQRY